MLEYDFMRTAFAAPRDGETFRQTVTALLGLEEALPGTWPGQAEVARFLAVSRARVGQIRRASSGSSPLRHASMNRAQRSSSSSE